jgi:ferredoxin
MTRLEEHLRVDDLSREPRGSGRYATAREPARLRRPRVCVDLLPEWISIDEWGYPIVNDPELPSELVEHARRAVNHCPVVALRLDPENV